MTTAQGELNMYDANLLDILVRQFNYDVLGIRERFLGLMREEEFKLSLHQLREEIDEIEEAYNDDNLVDVVDGLIDLDYFLKGVVYKHGISRAQYHQMFVAVHKANMGKVMGKKRGRENYGEAADAIKPDDWIAPEKVIAHILDIRQAETKDES